MNTWKEALIHESQNQNFAFEEGKLLADCSSFHIGGPLSLAVYPKDEDGLIFLISFFKKFQVPYRVFGCCSNILFPDDGFDGAILFTRDLNQFENNEGRFTVGAGVSYTYLSSKVQKCGYSGLEFAYGIPGSVGGAVYMNAGAYDHFTSETLIESRYLDLDTMDIRNKTALEHCFSYRHSSYMKEHTVILSATFQLQKEDPALIRQRMDEYMEKRKSKQPLEYPSAGSVFKRYEGYFTAKLIDEAGLKGYKIGGAQVSTKHAGFIVNVGNATSEDVRKLIKLIQDRIYELHQIHIERELIYFS